MSLTKQQYLAYMATLSVAKLEKLYNYSQFIVIPDEELLVNVTMDQMRQKALQLAAIHFPEWTDQSETDFGMFLTELMCLFSEKDFWYINGFANQALLMKMSLYSSAFIRAVELNYEPAVTKSASANFTLTFAPGSAVTYLSGELLIKTAGGVSFTNSVPIVLASSLSSFATTMALRQGEYITEEFKYNGKSIELRKPLIDIDLIELTINGVLWTRVANFGQSTSSSVHYMVLPEEDGKCGIYFGDGTYGKIPTVGDACTVKYLTCLGAPGSIAIDTGSGSVTKQNPNHKLSTFLMTTAATGGVSPTPLSELKNATLNYFTLKNACINEFTTLKWLQSHPLVARAAVFISGNTTLYYWVTKTGAAPTLLEQAQVDAELYPLMSHGYTPSYQNTVNINTSPIVLDCYYLQGYDPQEIETAVKQLIEDFTNPLVLADYGTDFNLSDVTQLAKGEITGLQNLVFITVAGLPAANITVGSTQLLSKTLIANITVNMIAV